MDVLRTPDERFAALPDYPFASQYADVGARMAYVDEGPAQAAPCLLMHGEPTWSYLYRRTIDVLASAGHRVIAPDLIGFGRSDKPTQRHDHSYANHVTWMAAFVERLDLRNITLVCHDWGGLIGLRVLAENPERFARVLAANTALPTGEQRMPDAFHRWRSFSQNAELFAVGNIVSGGTLGGLSDELIAAYDAPFPDDSYTAGPRQMPMLVPVTADDPAGAANRAAWAVLEAWRKPFLCAFSDGDPITRGADRVFQARIPGCAGQAHLTIAGGGHFLQEDRPDEFAAAVLGFLAATG